MKTRLRKPWSRDELIIAINLYCRTPFGKIHYRNPEIVSLAKKIGRTPGSVSYKLANFASIDPTLNRKGATNTSKLDRDTWQEFFEDWPGMIEKSEQLIAALEDTDSESKVSPIVQAVGKTKDTVVEVRINQSYFREMILSSYGHRCCITGIENPELLVASHISPWAIDEENRMNPCNGLCLNALHDRAFDRGLLTINDNYTVRLSRQLRHTMFIQFSEQRIRLPTRFLPDRKLLGRHRTSVFRE